MKLLRQAFPFVVVAVCLSSASVLSRQTPSLPTGLKIVVIAGEDAVNIVQQKTAVAPIVEVRDRNDQPVAGAVVNFAIRGGRATFGGARTLAVTTDVAGRAVAAGFTPTASGAVQIGASVTVQGQTAAVTIAQTNVMNAAQAAAAASSGAGSGGGISGTTLGVIGGVVAGGALGAVKAAGGDETPIVVATTYAGPFSGQLVNTFTTSLTNNRQAVCVHTRNLTGTLTLVVNQQTNGALTGTATTTTVETGIAEQGCNAATTIGSIVSTSWNLQVNGTAPNLASSGQISSTDPLVLGGSVTRTLTLAFAGTLSAGVISGTLTFSRLGSGINNADPASPAAPITESGSTTIALTLR